MTLVFPPIHEDGRIKGNLSRARAPSSTTTPRLSLDFRSSIERYFLSQRFTYFLSPFYPLDSIRFFMQKTFATRSMKRSSTPGPRTIFEHTVFNSCSRRDVSRKRDYVIFSISKWSTSRLQINTQNCRCWEMSFRKMPSNFQKIVSTFPPPKRIDVKVTGAWRKKRTFDYI